MEKRHIKQAERQLVRRAWRPKASEGHRCPHCGAAVKASYAICPECGRSLTPCKCSFCGAPMKETAQAAPSTGVMRRVSGL